MGSFTIKRGSLDSVISSIKKERVRADSLIRKKVTGATNIIYAVAHAKRPMITNAQAKAEGRKSLGKGKYERVSDPNAEAGVPVRTGALQASIQKSVSATSKGWLGRIWTSWPYAAFMEYGTSRVLARPYMRPAVVLTRSAIKVLFAKQEDA